MTNLFYFGENKMQNQLVDFANDAISVNAKLLNRSIEVGVKSAQEFASCSTKHAGDWLKVKTVDDYAATQENWNQIAIEQSKKAAQSAIELGTEAYDAYLSLWQKYGNADLVKPVVELKPVAKKA